MTGTVKDCLNSGRPRIISIVKIFSFLIVNVILNDFIMITNKTSLELKEKDFYLKKNKLPLWLCLTQ
jgi:hypothetical protein